MNVLFWMILAVFYVFCSFKGCFFYMEWGLTYNFDNWDRQRGVGGGWGLSWSFEVCLREYVNYSTLNLFSLLSKLILLLTLHASRSYFEISENWQSLKIITCIKRKVVNLNGQIWRRGYCLRFRHKIKGT